MTHLEVHDLRCEQGNTLAHRLTCRCADRRAARALTRECGTAAALSTEAEVGAVLNVGELIDAIMHRATASLMQAVAQASRAPILSTLHLISEYDRWLEGTTFRLAVLTVPLGTPTTDALLEVADDWMRARGLRH